MKYDNTGQFTPEMEKLAKQIRNKIKKLRDLGCAVAAKQNCLEAYTTQDYRHSQTLYATDYRLKSLDCGHIDDAGADDEEFFEDGYIDG